MHLKIKSLFLLMLLLLLPITVKATDFVPTVKPLVLLVVDKMDTVELLQCELPNVQRLLNESALGLLNIRSESGYTNTNSAYLTIGAGNRAKAPGVYNGSYAEDSRLERTWRVADFWSWSAEDSEVFEDNLLVPEIGWISRQFGERDAIPGMLGQVFRDNGWRTVVLGNVDRMGHFSRPSGLILMDENGLLDGGAVDHQLAQRAKDFPYGLKFNAAKALKLLREAAKPQTLIALEFGDFARLNASAADILPEQYDALKAVLWDDFDAFIGKLLDEYSADDLDLMVISPSLSRESWANKHSLGIMAIRSSDFHPGILTSGTTRWHGLVANLDILPTLVSQAGLTAPSKMSGRTVRVVDNSTPVAEVKSLNERLTAISLVQRALLDNYLLVIYLGWLGGVVALLLKRRKLAIACFMTVVWSALVLLLLPLLPTCTWNVACFYALTLLGGLIFWLFNRSALFTGVCVVLWVLLTVDQMTGWNLIRYCGLGYSASAGSRYYGMGNELMGTYLAAAFMMSHYLMERTKCRWWIWPIMSISLLILLSPRYGADFGGTLSLLIALLFYIYSLLARHGKQQILWIITAIGVLGIIVVGLWDASRPIEQQTHVGMFFRMFLSLDFTGLGLIIMRKLTMNLRLLWFSPWTRVVLTALAIVVGLNYLHRLKPLRTDAKQIWYTMLVCAVASELLNDSGIVALGTYLAVALSFYLLEGLKEEKTNS